jgi:hypothetical protein
MRNDAMFVRQDEMNEFTKQLAAAAKDNPVKVKLRNDTWVEVVYGEEEGDGSFHSPDWSRCWNLDGSSFTSTDFDIVEM